MKELLRIVIYEDINKMSEITIEGKTIPTNQSLDLVNAIDTMLRYRLNKNHEKIMNDMKNKGAIKSI